MRESLGRESRGEIARELARRLRRFGPCERPRVSSGCEPLDRLLPGGGFAPGTLVEWLGSGRGHGASILALMAAREPCRKGGVVVVVDRRRTFYPPAAMALGFCLSDMIVVHPATDADESWALDQVLRSDQVAAVLAWPEQLDSRIFRRLQLAAETSGVLGLLIRQESARAEPSWADVRLLVRPRAGNLGWSLCVEILRCRGSGRGGVAELEIDESTGVIHEANPLHLAAELAPAAADRGQARA